MSKLANLKKKAADLEHKRLFDRALSVYEEVLQEQEGAEEADIGLFNRVGDLHLRQGNVEAALKRYEQAVDLYVERGFHNNAVALCNKILRQDPSRAEIHFRLGQISCSKGFRTEARRHFQEYVAQLNRAGSLERAVTSLRTFADENGELDDVRLMLADILLTHGRVADAVAQLRLLREQYEALQRHGDAQAVLGRILELDPDFQVGPGASASAGPGAGDVAAAGVWLQPSQRTYAAPDLVLFDPSEFTTSPRAAQHTPSTPASEMAHIHLDLDVGSATEDDGPTAAEHPGGSLGDASAAAGTLSMPDGLTRGADFAEAATDPAAEIAPLDLAPLDLEPTTVEIEATTLDLEATTLGLEPTALDLEPTSLEIEPATLDLEPTTLEMGPAELMPTALEGLQDRSGDGQPSEAEEVEPVALAAAWGSEVVAPDDSLEFVLPDADDRAGWDESALSGEDEAPDPYGEPLIFITDETPVDSGVPDDAFTFPDLGATEQAVAPDDIAPPGGWELTADATDDAPVAADAAADVASDAAAASADELAVADALPPTDATSARVEEPAAAAELAAPDREPPPVVPAAVDAEASFVNLGDWLREDDEPRSTRMVAEERAPSGDEQADFAEMLRKFKQGVADNVDEDDHASHYDLGIAFREMGLVDEAIAAFQKALRGAGKRVRAFEALGQCFIDKEQFAVATSVLQRALQEPGADDERLVGVLYLLGRSAEAQNQRTEALRYYQRVFAVDIEFGDVADRIGTVERVPL